MAEVPNRVPGTTLGTSTATILTAGALNTYKVIRTIRIVCENSTAVTVTYGVGTTNTDAGPKRLAKSLTINPGEPFDDSAYIVLLGHGTTPDLLYALCSVASGASIYVAYVDGP